MGQNGEKQTNEGVDGEEAKKKRKTTERVGGEQKRTLILKIVIDLVIH